MIREIRDGGMKINNIAEELGLSRPTVRKYLKSKEPPEYYKKRCISILEEFREMGYAGGYTILKVSSFLIYRSLQNAFPLPFTVYA